jgi:hypothetical protein
MSAYSLDLRERRLLSQLRKASPRQRLPAVSGSKHLLRKSGARTKEALIEAMGRALGAVSAQDVRGFFTHCGYRSPAQQL